MPATHRIEDIIVDSEEGFYTIQGYTDSLDGRLTRFKYKTKMNIDDALNVIKPLKDQCFKFDGKHWIPTNEKSDGLYNARKFFLSYTDNIIASCMKPPQNYIVYAHIPHAWNTQIVEHPIAANTETIRRIFMHIVYMHLAVFELDDHYRDIIQMIDQEYRKATSEGYEYKVFPPKGGLKMTQREIARRFFDAMVNAGDVSYFHERAQVWMHYTAVNEDGLEWKSDSGVVVPLRDIGKVIFEAYEKSVNDVLIGGNVFVIKGGNQ